MTIILGENVMPRMFVCCTVWHCLVNPIFGDETVDVSDGTHWAIYTMGIDGSNLRPLHPMPNVSGQGSPSWSHDGKMIAFDAWGENNDLKSNVFVVDVDGNNLEKLGPGGMPAWSNDDKIVSYQCYGSKWGTWMRSVAKPKIEKQIVARGLCAQWSPSGTSLAYVAVPSHDLMLMDVATKKKTKLASNIELGIGWSPDGKQICAKRLDPTHFGHYRIVSFSLEGDDAVSSTRTIAKGKTTGHVKWSPDGKWIAAGGYDRVGVRGGGGVPPAHRILHLSLPPARAPQR